MAVNFKKAKTNLTLEAVQKSSLKAESVTVTHIALDKIESNPLNEEIFGMGNIEDLNRAIEETGYIDPIRVFEMPNGKYQIYSGHRRCERERRRGEAYITAIVEPFVSEEDALRKTIASNMFTRELKPLMKAKAIHHYKSTILSKVDPETGKPVAYPDKACMDFFGLTRTNYYRYINLLKLSPELQSLTENELFPSTFIMEKAVAEMDEEQQKKLYEKISETYDEELKLYAIKGSEIKEIICEIKGVSLKKEEDVEEVAPTPFVEVYETKTYDNFVYEEDEREDNSFEQPSGLAYDDFAFDDKEKVETEIPIQKPEGDSFDSCLAEVKKMVNEAKKKRYPMTNEKFCEATVREMIKTLTELLDVYGLD